MVGVRIPEGETSKDNKFPAILNVCRDASAGGGVAVLKALQVECAKPLPLGAGRVLTGIVGCGDGDELFPKEAALFKKARLLSVRSCWSEARASLATLIDGKMLSLSQVYEERLATDEHRCTQIAFRCGYPC